MRSSNQQSLSVSIRSKRDQLRNQVRREQLEKIFKNKRMELMKERQQDEISNLFKRLQEDIQNFSEDDCDADHLMREIQDSCQKFNSYTRKFILIGSFLMKKQEKLFDFQNLIINEENLALSNCRDFSYCIAIYFAFFCNLMEKSTIEDCYQQLEKRDLYLGFLLKNFWDSFKISEQNMYVMENYFFCLEQFIYYFQNKNFFPIHSFNALIQMLGQFYGAITSQKVLSTRGLKLAITRLINQIVAQIKSKELYSNEIRQFIPEEDLKYLISTRTMQKFMKVSAQIFHENLVDTSDQRNKCLISIKTFCECNPITAGEFLFTQKNLKEYQFLMINHNVATRQLLLRSVNAVLPSITNGKLIEFLDQSFHINLTEILRQIINGPQFRKLKSVRISSEQLFLVLKVIQMLLFKVQELDRHIFIQVFDKMNMNGFGDLIELMQPLRFDEKIEDVWSIIVDNYFSEDMCQENHMQKQNHCKSMNSGEHSYQSEKNEKQQFSSYNHGNYQSAQDQNEEFTI